MLEMATVSNFLTNTQELVSVENLVGKDLLQLPDLIKDLVAGPSTSVRLRILCGVLDIAIKQDSLGESEINCKIIMP